MFLQQAHDKTLVSINNHLVNGKGDDGVQAGGGVSGGRLSVLKEEILRELEKRVSLSCSSCQVIAVSHSSTTVWEIYRSENAVYIPVDMKRARRCG